MKRTALTDSVSTHESSYVRTHEGGEDPRERGLARVAEFLRALGLSDRLRVAALSEEIVSSCEEQDRAQPGQCVAEAQRRVRDFRREVFGEHEAQVDALWLRSFIAAHPDAFLADANAARALVQRFGDPFQGRPPTPQRFREQSFSRMAFPRWAVGLLPSLTLVSTTTALLVYTLAADGLSLLEGVWASLYLGLSFLLCTGVSAAFIGFFSRHAQESAGERSRGRAAAAQRAGHAHLPRERRARVRRHRRDA